MAGKPKIKICGLTSKEEVKWVVEAGADYAGFVLFFPKSKRNLTKEQAGELLEALKKNGCRADDGQDRPFPKSVAVVVSPTPAQIGQIKELGFDYIQIHGTISAETLQALDMPVIRAINVGAAVEAGRQTASSGEQFISQIQNQVEAEKGLLGERLFACLFDAAEPGSGKVFDWELLSKMPRLPRQLFLAGGLDAHNVRGAVKTVMPDVVDVSSGVEKSEDTVGKERTKIIEFVRKVRTDE